MGGWGGGRRSLRFSLRGWSLVLLRCRCRFGPRGARAFIGCHQRVVNHWIVNRGYSIGIGDTIADATTMDEIVNTIEVCARGAEAARVVVRV